MKDQLDSTFANDNKAKKSKSGKGLDTAALVMGIIGFLWACIPYVGAGSLVITTTGVLIGFVALFRAKGGGEIRRGMAITGTVLNIVAIGISIFWVCKIVTKVMESIPEIEQAAKNLDTASVRQNIEKALDEVDSTAH